MCPGGATWWPTTSVNHGGCDRCKAVKGFGEPLQYSVFICDLNALERTAMCTELASTIRHTEDSVVTVDLGLAGDRGRLCFDFMGVTSRWRGRGSYELRALTSAVAAA